VLAGEVIRPLQVLLDLGPTGIRLEVKRSERDNCYLVSPFLAFVDRA
jgi:hypothetical protein